MKRLVTDVRIKLLLLLIASASIGMFMLTTYAFADTCKTGLVASTPILVWTDKDVSVTPRGLSKDFKGQAGLRLDSGDVITAGKKAFCYVLFPSNTIVVLNPYTKVEITDFTAGVTEGVHLHQGAITVKNRDASLINQFAITSQSSMFENSNSNSISAHFVKREDKSLMCVNFADSIRVKSKGNLNNLEAQVLKDSFIEVSNSGKLISSRPLNSSLNQLKEQALKRADFVPVGEELAFALKQMKKIAMPRKLNN